MTQIKLKKGDVYHFQIDWEKNKDWNFGNNHCFEGILVVMESDEKGLILKDTFWGVNRGDNKTFTLKEALELGKLSFYCNLSEITKIPKWEADYYDDKDVVFLHDQHACVESCQYYYIRNGSKRSKEAMLKELNRQVEEAKRKADWAIREVEQLGEKRAKIENGDLTIYI